MKESKTSCQLCVLHTGIPGITVNESGFCSICENYRQFEQHEPKIKKYLREEMDNQINKAKNSRRPYDVIILFSGGKDSTILLKMAKEHFQLRPLAISVIHPLVNETARQNMEIVAGKLNVDLIKVFPDESVYKKVVKYGIERGIEYGLGEFFGCDICSFFHSWIPIRYAMKLGVPVILEGSDSSQTGEMTYWQSERVKEDAKKGKKPFGRVHDLFIDALGDEYKGSIYDYDETEIINGRYPTFISPFTFLEYDYRKNFSEIESIGLKSKAFRSIYTNCSATPFFSYFSLKKFGCVSYIKHYANEVRRGYPNLMQRSLNDNDTADVLNKDMVILLMTEYKNVVYYVVENKLTEETITEGEREKLINMAPNYLRLFGEDVCNVFLHDVLQIYRFADYFNVDLNLLCT